MHSIVASTISIFSAADKSDRRKLFSLGLALGLSACFLSGAQAVAKETPLTRWVNPFIGTAGGGNTFPGAVRPWGMVSVSPHTAPGSPSGYLHGAPFFYGFGMVHLSGTGCADLGSILVVPSRRAVAVDPEAYKCRYKAEEAAPGYYRCMLREPAVRVEVTASDRCGLLRFMPTESGELNLLIDVGRNLSRVGGGLVRLDEAGAIEGYNIGGGFCGETNRHRIYFSARLDASPSARGLWQGEALQQQSEAAGEETPLGAWVCLQVRKNQPILLKIGISYVSVANARENLDAEIPGWNFERVRREACDAWQKELAVVEVSGGTADARMAFYTALYHALIHPNLISDVNGDYPLMGRSGIGRYHGRNRYTVYSLWDTYRTLHPLLTLLYPGRQSEIVRTMLDMYRESGFLPKWELAGNETFMMVGDGAGPVLADSWVKGLRDFDGAAAWEAARKPVFLGPGEEAPPIRAGYHEQLRWHYIPCEQDTAAAWWVWGPVSTSLEYCYSDWTLAQLARQTGHSAEAAELEERSLWYRHLFDPGLQLLRPKRRDGTWLEPFDPLATEGSGSWSGSGGPGYVEGNAWNYTWFVPHDVPGLIELFGGPAPFARKLEECFREDRFTITNEPDIGYPWLFTWIPGQEYRTRQIVAGLRHSAFSSRPDGLPGNDDCGAISAWYLFATMGFYPLCPGAPEYRLNAPLFDRAVIHLDPRYGRGGTFTITAFAGSGPILLNGAPLAVFALHHEQITAGGVLQLPRGEVTD
ncbi:MAG TPA: GH92 family glycosyl hydrolase [bacterium]|nr:GH92 family glycosyl hydrolase [bacterium]